MDVDCRFERMIVIVGYELVRYNIVIVVFSEIRRVDIGCVKEMGVGYIFFWSGKIEIELRVFGVGFVIRNDIVLSFIFFFKGILDRIMILRLFLTSKIYLIFISVYVFIMIYLDEEREVFYFSLREVIYSV